MQKKKLGILLSTPPSHPNLSTVTHLCDEGLRSNVDVYLYLIDEGVKSLTDQQLLGLSKAGAKLLPGASMHGATLGRTPGRAGESANQLGTGSLGAVGPTEMGAVEGTDIPEEYREQVGRYFEP